MNEQQVGKTLEDSYDPDREDSLRSMVGDFYNRKMLTIVIVVWFWAVVFVGGAVACGVAFAGAEQIKAQIMYAALFVCCVQFIALLKVVSWQMIHKNRIIREIKRLEMRVVEAGSQG